jgi:hypothetical protein
MATNQEHFDQARKWQAYYDEVLREVGMRAPEPMLGRTVSDYRRETCRQIKRTFLPQNHDLYKVSYRGLQTDALDVFEPQLLKAAADEAFNPATVEPGQFREITRRDKYDGVREILFVGPESFVRSMGRPGRRVVRFNATAIQPITNDYVKSAGWVA